MSDGLRIPGYDAEPRECGGCHACCIAPQIDHLAKPARVRCWHLDEYRGCSIYDQRGEVCRRYRCLWLMGALGVGNRPDKLGVAFTLFSLADGTPAIGAMELWAGALDEPLGSWAVGCLLPVTGLMLRILADGRTAWAGEKELVDRAVDLSRQAKAEEAPRG